MTVGQDCGMMRAGGVPSLTFLSDLTIQGRATELIRARSVNEGRSFFSCSRADVVGLNDPIRFLYSVDEVLVMTRPHRLLLLSACSAIIALGCAHPANGSEPQAASRRNQRPAVQFPAVVAVTVTETGRVVLLDRTKLTVIRTVAPQKPGAAPGPMLVVEDAARRVFYVGNFNGGLGRIPIDGGKTKTLDLGGQIIGVAISPDGKLLAVNGAHDLMLRLIDLDAWKVAATLRFGTPSDAPLHSPLTHGLASTHPVWLADGSGVLVQNNIHEEVVLIGRDGKEKARRRLRSAVHTFLTTPAGDVLALLEGTIDGKIAPRVAVLAVPALKVVREIVVPLAPAEPAKLHHGALSPDGKIVVVANMGPMHGSKYGKTVAALRWQTGEVIWHVPSVRNAGHVRFLDAARVLVLGHHSADLPLLDARTGKVLETWRVAGATALGHSLSAEPDGTALVIDSSAGRLVRVGNKGIVGRSPALGEGVSEASLPE